MKMILTAAIGLLLPGGLAAQSSRTALSSDGYAVTNVTVIPMTGESVLSDAAVLVRKGRIEALGPSSPVKTSVSDRGLFQPKAWESLAYLDSRKIAEIAGVTARAGVWTSPTLHVFHTAFALGQTEEAIRGRPDWKMMPAKLRTLYLGARERYWRNPPEERFRRVYVETRNRLVKTIADSGGGILAGSDSPEWFLGYGFTLHRELEALVAAGLTPFQALAAATRNPAQFLNASADWASIAPGKRADLVLLSANPLDDIRNTTRIEAVSVGGRWLERAALAGMIRAAETALGGEP